MTSRAEAQQPGCDCDAAVCPLQQEADKAAALKQTVQQLLSSQKAAEQSEQQLQEQVQQLRQSSSDKENSLVQLQRRCQSTEMQLQVSSSAVWQACVIGA